MSKQYAAEDLQPVGSTKSPETIRKLWPLWAELDRLLLREFMCWPWESQNPQVGTVWERLTHPDNLAALEAWSEGVESFDEFAKGCTLRALAECLRVKAGHEQPRTGSRGRPSGTWSASPSSRKIADRDFCYSVRCRTVFAPPIFRHRLRRLSPSHRTSHNRSS